MGLIEWHKNYVKGWQDTLGLSDYALLWLAFIKGILLTLFIVWLL